MGRSQDIHIKPEDAVEIVYDALQQTDSPLFIHTDNSVHKGKFKIDPQAEKTIGCADINGSAKNPDVMMALIHIQRLRDQGANIVVDTLQGHHEETALLLVHGTKQTVRSNDGSEMVFRVDVDRRMNFLESLAKRLRLPGGQKVTGQQLDWVSNRRTASTAQKIAKNTPVFTVNAGARSPEKTLKFKGRIK